MKKKISKTDVKTIVKKIVHDCEVLAQSYIDNWEAIIPESQTIEGCAYLRLSDDSQVIVEKGSLEQQVNIAINEALIRSHKDQVNYKITEFYIEPGITAKHDRRPKFQLMQENIRNKKHQFVILKELSRASRDFLVWKNFFKTCIDNECEIIIRGLPFNPNNPTEIFQLDILAAFAEYESNQTSKRVKESNYSAMVTSGKFNQTLEILGLDQKVQNGEKKVGLYEVNKKEVKIVEYIMKSFLEYSSYQVVLEKLKKEKILNKSGKNFTRHTLKRLLTNIRYIGKWEVNSKNKSKNQTKLMPYERYKLVGLPHGKIIQENLWDKVQAKVEELSQRKDKNTKVCRVYPLSGILMSENGTTFAGMGAWSRTGQRHSYYVNKSKNLRIKAELLEDEVRNSIAKLIQSKETLQNKIAKYASDVLEYKIILESKKAEISSEIEKLAVEKEKIYKRLDFFLDGDDLESMKAIRDKFTKEIKENELKSAALSLSLKSLTNEIEVKCDSNKIKREIASKANDALESLQNDDPVLYKNALRALIQKVILGEENENGERKLKILLKGQVNQHFKKDFLKTLKMHVQDSSISLKMVPRRGLEPRTQGFSVLCSTN